MPHSFKMLFLFAILSICSIENQAKEIKVGIGMIDYPPYYFEKDGLLQGALIEVSQHIADELGHTLIFEKYPWPRIQLYLREGNIDMVLISSKTADREKYAVFAEVPHTYETNYLFVKKGTELDFNGDIQSLNKHHFGSVRGYFYGVEYDTADQLNKQEASNEKQLIEMLLHKRIDIAIGNLEVIHFFAEAENVRNEISFIFPPINRTPSYFAFSKIKKDSTMLAHDFTLEVRKLIRTKKYREILNKYGINKE